MTKQEKQPNHALYLAYRPQRFADVAGQDPIVSTLRRALASGRVAHAYLFTGPRGTGKTTTARILAKGINCEKPKDGEPDGTCTICRSIADGSLLDVLEIDAASNRGIDEIRELRERVGYAPTKAKRKVYIIDEVHMLTKEAWGALLKTLEEPPEHVTFVLATTEPHKVPQTIISRCQRFDFKPATDAQLTKHLTTVAKAEGLTIDDEAAGLIARQARGGYRDALSVLDLLASVQDGMITAELVRETLGLAHLAAVAGLERALVARDAATAIQIIRDAGEQGIAAELFRTAVIDYLRTMMLAKVGARAPKRAAELAADWTLPHLTEAVRAFVEAGDLVAVASVPELPLELAALDLLDRFRTEPHAKVGTDAAETALRTVTEPPVADAPEPKAQPKQQPASAPKAAAKPAPAKAAASAPSAPKDAQELWERLLLATKGQYSLSVSLQKTRPLALSADTFELAVQSEFFREKLDAKQTKPIVEKHLEQLAGRPLKLKLSLAKPDQDDVFDAALKVFEGAEVE